MARHDKFRPPSYEETFGPEAAADEPEGPRPPNKVGHTHQGGIPTHDHELPPRPIEPAELIDAIERLSPCQREHVARLLSVRPGVPVGHPAPTKWADPDCLD